MIWIALAFCLVAVIGSLAYAATRGWRLWKTVRATSQRTAEATAEVLRAAEAAEAHVGALGAGAERLAAAMERLQGSLAELALLRSAAAETTSLLASVRGLVPRK